MKDIIPFIHVQWHITTNCGNRCKHCYMFDEETFENERRNTLGMDDLLRILNSMEEFERKWQVKIETFAISGGDPLLRPDWKEFITELRARDREVVMMGNPETLTNDNLAFLAEKNIRLFQMSLDGLEETHDYFRSPGSFKRTVMALDRLRDYGIRSNIMFTLYPNNAGQLIPLLNYVARETSAKSFSFDIGCFTGNGAQLDKSFTPADIQEILSLYFKEKVRMKAEGIPLKVAEKSNFFKLTRYAEGSFFPWNAQEIPMVAGCSVGWSSASILSDGTFLACRRMPLKAGKMPEQSFEEIFLGSPLLKKFRRPQFFKGCGACDFFAYCRGCPANSYSATGDPFAKHPYCFRDNLPAGKAPQPVFQSPPMDTGFAEELAWIQKGFNHYFHKALQHILDNKALQKVFLDIHYSPEEKQSFFKDPQGYLDKKGCVLPDEFIVFLVTHFGEFGENRSQEDEETPLLDYILASLLEEVI